MRRAFDRGRVTTLLFKVTLCILCTGLYSSAACLHINMSQQNTCLILLVSDLKT